MTTAKDAAMRECAGGSGPPPRDGGVRSRPIGTETIGRSKAATPVHSRYASTKGTQ